MLQFIVAYLVTAFVFLGIDVIWLSRVATNFYSEQLSGLLLETPRFGIAGAFYALYVVGIVIFAVVPGLRANSALAAASLGALFGFFAYATYDMTNYATLKGWSPAVVVVDITWGTILTGTSALLGYLGTRLILPS